MPANSLGPSSLPLVRTSERGTFKRCRFKWWLEFEDRVKPKVDVPPLRFGTLVHAALAAYYKPGIRRGPKPAETFEKLYLQDLADVGEDYDTVTLSERWDDAADLGIVMLERYYARYHPDDEWKVLVTEYPFQTIINRPYPRQNEPWLYYTGILDGVWENRRDGRKVIPDHKTTAAINTGYLVMDDQATSYWTFGVDALIRNGLLAPDGSEELHGILFNFLRKASRSDKALDPEGFVRNKPKKIDYIAALGGKRGFDPKWKLEAMEAFAKVAKVKVLGEISKVQPAPYHARVPIWRSYYERDGLRKRILAEIVDMEAVRHPRELGPDGISAGAYKNPGQFTCPGCWALDICELHEIGQDWTELRSMTTRQWDPYEVHVIREGR